MQEKSFGWMNGWMDGLVCGQKIKAFSLYFSVK
jgi:hypothetical protein